ncbi:MAG TPA: DUF3307 domain-containing protein [Rhodobacteraceae bacterium]|nr:DUF3307 domain-containing protein [Paracoccaceae bacterium]
MIETLVALLFAHIMADFLLQTSWMVAQKRNPLVLFLHASIVAALSYAALGFVGHWVVLAIAASHLLFDAVKTYWPANGWRAFLLDQSLHGAAILVAATQFPDLYSMGLWQDYGMLSTPPAWLARIPDGWIAALPLLMLLSAGLILATRAGGFFIGAFMKPLSQGAPEGLPKAGAIIGNLERGLAFLFILSGQPQNIGFLLAAKSVLRFSSAKEDRAVSEYVIIGTLMSFGWVIAVSAGVLALRELIA